MTVHDGVSDSLLVHIQNINSSANIFDNIGAMGSKVGFDLTKDLTPCVTLTMQEIKGIPATE